LALPESDVQRFISDFVFRTDAVLLALVGVLGHGAERGRREQGAGCEQSGDGVSFMGILLCV
jgi:hypothetical protein